LLSLGDFRAPAFSLRIGRCDGELELFMQLLGTYCGLLRCSSWYLELDCSKIPDAGYYICSS
jgi:hypothetical protein